MFSLQAQRVSDDLLQRVGSQNRRALDLVAAKCYYYHSRVYEFLNQLDTIRRYAHTHTYCGHKGSSHVHSGSAKALATTLYKALLAIISGY